MKYVINHRVGVVHTADCGVLVRIRPENVSDWDPAKAHLAPGVAHCPACLSHVPVEPKPVELLEDPSGAPYGPKVQLLVQMFEVTSGTHGEAVLIEALEETAWYAWRNGQAAGAEGLWGYEDNPHQTPEAER